MRNTWGSDLSSHTAIQNLVLTFSHLPVPNNYADITITQLSSLLPASIVSMVDHKLKNLFKADGYEFLEKEQIRLEFNCDAFCVEKLSLYLYYEQIRSDAFRYRNYRGIEQLLFQKVEEKIYNSLRKQPTKSSVKIKILTVLEPSPSLHVNVLRENQKTEF